MSYFRICVLICQEENKRIFELENSASYPPFLAAWIRFLSSTRRGLHLLYYTICHVNDFFSIGRLGALQLDMICAQMVKQTNTTAH